jgi:transposase
MALRPRASPSSICSRYGPDALADGLRPHVRAFEFYEGVPKLVVPDNTKTSVTKACRYDPD